MTTQLDRSLTDFSKRLNKALDDADFPRKGQGRQLALAKAMKVSQRGARRWLEGEAFPTHDKQQQLCKILRVNFEWLSAGRGAKRLTYQTGEIISEPAGETLTPQEENLVEAFRSLGPWDRKLLLDLVQRLKR